MPAPTARIAPCGGLMTASKFSIPNMPRLLIAKLPPALLEACGGGCPIRLYCKGADSVLLDALKPGSRGTDTDSMVTDLIDVAVKQEEARIRDELRAAARECAEERVLELLRKQAGNSWTEAEAVAAREALRAGTVDKLSDSLCGFDGHGATIDGVQRAGRIVQMLKQGKGIPGTVFRFPLRTKKLARASEICRRPFSEEDAMGVSPHTYTHTHTHNYSIQSV